MIMFVPTTIREAIMYGPLAPVEQIAQSQTISILAD